ncbi:glyceraldehyde-3-phosphate dehydrogenase [archaeon 13_1_20CM_2_54_9]|nr:MAG: glyceraldehyde-3-phosphate dehydrogenase [Crenarchaeota archaeon 13_1_40CM_3_53_5]OLE74180.1 MAG: glyceraldehyde-3-phosphate dehydrogenase [archaeon 13_1_20CM_2_54_9]TMI28116.1 MAG: type II glyceraldehyde-3-phosphate dehydrogenase [Candidatus Bathyarchaeota archaeon]
MPKQAVRVGVNGFGVIGKRVAEAVSKQKDMKLVGVSDVVGDYRVKMGVKKGFPIYCSVPDKLPDMKKAGVEVAGTLEDLLKKVDVIVDCTPAGLGAKNKAAYYDRAGVKSIFQGGEKHELTGSSFVAQCNYEENLNKPATRVVSCNTTGICRTVGTLQNALGVKKARVVLFRRGTDPWESHKAGLINTVVPEAHIPSHQGPDARTVLPKLNITTMAAKGPFNIGHLHFAMVQLKDSPELKDVLKVLKAAPRLAPVRMSDGVDSMNAVAEMMRDLGRPRADMWEVAYWEDVLSVEDGEVNMVYQVHNESVVVPENVDAIRSLTGLETNWKRSVALTDESLGATHNFLSQ